MKLLYSKQEILAILNTQKIFDTILNDSDFYAWTFP